MYYKIKNGSITLNGNTLLENIDFDIKDNEKVALIGRNGCGKTTFLKGILSQIPLEDGYDYLSLEKSPDLKIGYIKQNNLDDIDMTLLEYIKSSFSEIIEIENKISFLEQKLSTAYNEKLLNEYNTLQEKYIYYGGNTYKKEYEIMLKKFGFNALDKTRKLNTFSGGEKTKISLMHLLLSNSNLLILDEPTNHLDIEAVEWLENYLKNTSKSIILVSHDRMFIDNVCNIVYEIEFGSLKKYKGNYTYYLKKKEEDYNKALKDYEAQEKEIARLTKIVERFKYKPSKASMAMSKLKQIERLKVLTPPRKSTTRTFKSNFNITTNTYKETLKVTKLQIGYDIPLTTLNFTLYRKDKLGVIGRNGCGKTTLIKTLLGELPKLGGKYIFSNNTSIGYFSQTFENLDNNLTVYEEIDRTFPSMTPNEIRNTLGAFEFSNDDVFKKVSSLSGGEKVKLSLCKILNSNTNILLLDEPTNHLDLISKETIEKLLTNYDGTIIVVSHDRYLINSVCNKILYIDKDNTKLYNYGYEEYKNDIKRKNQIETSNSETNFHLNTTSPSSNNTNNTNTNIKDNEKDIDTKNRKATKPKQLYIPKDIKKEITKLEKALDNLYKEKEILENELQKEEVYTNFIKSSEISTKLDNINKEIDQVTTTWDNLTNNL